MDVKKLIALLLGVGLFAFSGPQKITMKQYQQVFPKMDAHSKMKKVEDISYVEAWDEGFDRFEEEKIGYVFLGQVEQNGKASRLLVSVDLSGKVVGVGLPKQTDTQAAFLKQFKGMTTQSDFGLAESSDDLLYVPAKLRAMRGDKALSAAIAQEVGKIMAVAGKHLFKIKTVVNKRLSQK